VDAALEEVGDGFEEVLPTEVLRGRGFVSRAEAVRAVHRPGSPEEGERAREVLALEDLYLYQHVLRRFRARKRRACGVAVQADEGALKAFADSLPFELTAAQGRAVSELAGDMAAPVPMRRLLQGDVGSGKTVVAAALCWLTHSAGLQSAVMAPTEVLASQHMRSLGGFLRGMGVGCGLLTGSTPAGERRRLAEALAQGEVSVLVGTHAVIEGSVPLERLGLLVVDEQHKFGVRQRESLLVGREPRPHLMVMTATPIPRTMAMTIYGDMDLAVLDEMPPGRGSITTRVMDRGRRGEIFDFLLQRLEQGERAFIVYPLREASEKQDLRDATSAWEILREGPLGPFGVSLLHGSMSGEEKVAATEAFASGRSSVLVSTTVIEVGIDVPEATVMVISGAERFGLSQLHQLRGRIGRSGRDGWCFLVHGDRMDSTAWERLRILSRTTDGFRIAEKDLELRGPGEVIGTRQHGLPDFPVADLERDVGLLEEARSLAAGYDPPADLESRFEKRFGRPSPLAETPEE
jgi:ATP-dependent DNA helicase RecG